MPTAANKWQCSMVLWWFYHMNHCLFRGSSRDLYYLIWIHMWLAVLIRILVRLIVKNTAFYKLHTSARLPHTLTWWVKHDNDTTSVLSPATLPFSSTSPLPSFTSFLYSLSLSSFSSSDVTLVPQRNERCVCWCSQQMATSRSWMLTPELSWILSSSQLL